MVRHIGKRLKRQFTRDAKLLEAATRAIAVFSSNSKEAAEAAADIQLVADDPQTVAQRRVDTLEGPSVNEDGTTAGIQGPPNLTGSLPSGAKADGNRLNLDVEELPDDSERKVTPKKPVDNSAGSFERLLGMGGGMTSTG